MVIRDTLEVVLALHRWVEGAGTIKSIEHFLGDKTGSLTNMLQECSLIDPWGKALHTYPTQVIIDAALLYIAMRHG